MFDNLPDPATLIPLLFALSVIPVLVVMVTSYTKLVVVFSLMRHALGLQQVPPPMVTNGLALVLTWYIMYPIGHTVMTAVNQEQARQGGAVTYGLVIEEAREPLKDFLQKHVSEREVEFFYDASQRMMAPEVARTVERDGFLVLIPAFTISELTKAFLIGFLIFLPFIVVDLIVANVLLAMGMQMMAPTIVSLPIKLLLFVLLDGWSRITHALVLSYQ